MPETASAKSGSTITPAPTPAPTVARVVPAAAKSPQDTPHRPTPWWVWVIVAVVVIGTGIGIYLLVQSAKGQAVAKSNLMKAKHDTPVVVAEATRGDLQIYLTGLGTVTPVSTVSLHTRVDGQIVKLFFTEGQFVKQGDDLMTIDPAPYEAVLAQANAQLAKDQAGLTNATSTVTMDTQAIASGGAISKQQLLTDTATMQQDQAAIDVDKASIKAAEVNVAYCHIKSPCDGLIGLRKVDEGNIVHAADTTPLAVITQLKPITVVFTLAEDDIGRVQKQIAAQAKAGKKVQVLAFDRDLGKQLAVGTLLAIDSQIDSGSGTIAIKALFPNDDLKLFPQQFVNARVQVETIQNAVLVPSAAIQPGANGPYVYIVNDLKAGEKGQEGTVALRPVTVGANQPAIRPGDEDLTVVTAGLKEGDTVVIDGVDKLIDGAKVAARPAPAPTTRPAADDQTFGDATTMPTTNPTTGGHGGAHGGHRRPQ